AVLAISAVAGLVRDTRARMAAIAVVAATMIVPGWLTWKRDAMLADNYGAALRRAHLQLGIDLLRRTRPDAVVAMDDVGLAPLLSERRTIDMLGLNDAHIAGLEGGFGKSDPGYVLALHPDLIVLLAKVRRP